MNGSPPIYYIHTSVLLHVVYGDSESAVAWFEGLEPFTALASSLLRLEAVRTLRRDGLDPAAADPYLSHVALFPVDQTVMQYAEQIQQHVKSPGAIYPATLMSASPIAILASHDANLLAAAATRGISTTDPVSSP
ncbi:MAG: hypothetical protein LBK95_18450 [Bifidobacteriaceae bacterium]|nr:hypothetical protein [Bifidobacteriaceae bacterium]